MAAFIQETEKSDRHNLKQLREAEIANVPFLVALAGCSARRSERRVASHTSEAQRRNAPGSAAKNGILAFSASLSAFVGSANSSRTADQLKLLNS